MKSFLISIKPQWVEKILNGEKIYEIRKTIPKEWKEYLRGETSVKPAPSKWYIYCTNGYMLYDLRNEDYLKLKNNFTLDITHKSNKYLSSNPPLLNRRIVAEFTLNEIEEFDVPYPAYFYEVKDKLKHITDSSCLTLDDLHRYLKNDSGYALRIEDLEIYDKPKELSEFRKINRCHYSNYEDFCCFECCTFYDLGDCDGKYLKIKRPPQSWCSVENLEEK